MNALYLMGMLYLLHRNEDAINQMAVPPFPYQPSFLSPNEVQ